MQKLINGIKNPSHNTKSNSIQSMLRVDHAGEFGAIRIYKGQLAALKDKKAKDLVMHMLDQEYTHFNYFNEKMKNKEFRKSLLMPFWNIAGYTLGYITASMSPRAAMACTVAVEETIDEHYLEQIKKLSSHPEEADLLKSIERFRQEELEHRDIGIENKAKETIGYKLISNTIKLGCRAAIAIAKKF